MAESTVPKDVRATHLRPLPPIKQHRAVLKLLHGDESNGDIRVIVFQQLFDVRIVRR
jgi:hypothetical protein